MVAAAVASASTGGGGQRRRRRTACALLALGLLQAVVGGLTASADPSGPECPFTTPGEARAAADVVLTGEVETETAGSAVISVERLEKGRVLDDDGRRADRVTVDLMGGESPFGSDQLFLRRGTEGLVLDPCAQGSVRVVERVAGSDRVGTAVALSRYLPTSCEPADPESSGPSFSCEDFRGSVDIVGASSPVDALVSSRNFGAVLLTPRETLTAEVREALAELDPFSVNIIGGEGSVSREVEEELRRMSESSPRVLLVTRFAGADRYETAADLAGEDDFVLARGDVPDGEVGADALTSSGFAPLERRSLLLTPRDHLAPAVEELIERRMAQGESVSVLIVGGEAAVSRAVEDAVLATGARVTRVGGRDRYETALMLADRLPGSGEVPAYLASGTSPVDAVTAAPVAARDGAAILLADPAGLTSTPAVADWLSDHAERAVLIGGTGALPETFDFAAERALTNSTPSRTRLYAGVIPTPGMETPYTAAPVSEEPFLVADGEATTVDLVFAAVEEPVVIAGRFGGVVPGGTGALAVVGPGCEAVRAPGSGRVEVECEEVVLELGTAPVTVPITIDRRVATVGRLPAISHGEFTTDLQVRVADAGVPPPDAQSFDVRLLLTLDPPVRR